MPTRQLDLTGAQLTYREAAPAAGSAARTPILFLHANTGTSVSWSRQLEHFSALGYRALALDRCGWGASRYVGTGPRVDEADLLAEFIERLELGACHLVATAGSAFAALRYASRSGVALRSLTLIATLGALGLPEVREFADRIKHDREPLPPSARELSAGYRGSDPTGTREWVAIEERARTPDALTLGSTPVTQDMLEHIRVPVLVIAGGADIIAPPALMRLWVRHLPSSHLEVVDEAGHAVAWERPDTVNSLLHDFFEPIRCEPSSRRSFTDERKH